MGKIIKNENVQLKHKAHIRVVSFVLALIMMLPLLSSGVTSLVDMGVLEAEAADYSIYPNDWTGSFTYKKIAVTNDPSSMENYNFVLLPALYAKTYSKDVAGATDGKSGNTMANDDIKFNYYKFAGKSYGANDCAAFLSRCISYGGASMKVTSSKKTVNGTATYSNSNNGWYGFGIDIPTFQTDSSRLYPKNGTNSGAWSTVQTQFGSFTKAEFTIACSTLANGDKSKVVNASKQIGDYLWRTPKGRGHSMIVVSNGTSNATLAASNHDGQFPVSDISESTYLLARPTAFYVINGSSASNSIQTKIDGRAGYGYGEDGNGGYSGNSQIAYFYVSKSGSRYETEVKHSDQKGNYRYTDEGTVNIPVTTPKITDRNGKILYCTTFYKQHPSSWSYIKSSSSYTYGNVDSLVYLNGWHDDSESMSTFNSRMRSLIGSSYTDLKNPYEAYAATQYAMWKVDGSSENSLISSVHPWKGNSTKQNYYATASQRVYDAGVGLANYAKSAASSGSASVISAVPRINTTNTSTLETKERTINGVKYLIQGPINIQSRVDTSSVSLKGVQLLSNNPNIKITQSNSDSAITNASAKLSLDNGSNWNIYVAMKKPDKGNEAEATVALSAVTIPAVVTSGAKYYTYTAEKVSQYLQNLFSAEGSPERVSGQFNVKFEFENVYGQISLSKVNKRGEKLAGITFGIYEDQACTKLAEFYPSNTAAVVTTGTNGSINSDYLPTSEESPVTYYVKERSMTSAQSQLYALNSTVYPVAVVHDKINPVNNGVSIINDWLPSRVSVYKEDENGTRLSGIKFGVYTTEQCTQFVKDVNGNNVTMTTDSNGLATSAQIQVNDNGQKNIYVKEISIDSKYGTSYVLNTKVYSATLSAGKTVSIGNGDKNNNTVINEWANGSFSIHKVDDDGVNLPEIVFAAFEDADCHNQAFDASGTPILLQTDSNGRATSGQIKVNKNGIKTLYLKEMQMTSEQEKYYEYLKETMTISVIAGRDTPYGANIVNDHIVTDVPIVKTDSLDGTPIPSAEITVYDVNGNEVCKGFTDSNGKFVAPRIRVGQYTFKETKTPEPSATGGKGYQLNEGVFEFTVNSDKSISGITEFTDKPTEVVLYKKDVVSLMGVPGARLAVYDKMDSEVATGLTDTDGKITVSYLPYGTYTFKETVAPEGYVRNTETFTFSIDRNGVVTGDNTITNKQTEFHALKTDATDGRPVEGAQIAVYWLPDFVDTTEYLTPELVEVSASDIVSNSDATKKETQYKFKDASKLIDDDSVPYYVGYTEDNGDFAVFGLPIGKYVFREISVPDNDYGYQLNLEAYAFVINEDGSITGCNSFTNKPTEIKITKTDLTTEEPVAGAEIVIYDESGKEMLREVTDEKGEINAFYLPKGTYFFKETVAPEGYILNSETFKFTINELGVQTGTSNITNQHTEVKITKTDLTTSKPVPGAEITIYDKDGNEVYKDLTGEDGSVTAFRLLPGDYTFKETLAPDGTAGYQINLNTFNFTIKNDGTVEGMVNFTDEPTKVTLTKSDLTTSEKVPDAEITVYNDENEKVFSGYTDSKGELEITYLPAGEYTFKETVAPDGYIINEAVFRFVIHPDGSVTGDTDVSDKPTEVKITKSDLTTSDGVSGAEITIYDEDGNEVYKDITDEHGNITAFRLPVGTYTFKETVAPEGYLINEAVFTFIIHEDGSVTGDDTVVDERIQGNVQIMKVDSQNKDKKLEGATFYVFDEQGMMVDTVTTDKNGIATTKLLDYGIYTFTEVNAPEGYALPEESTRVLVSEHQKTYSVTITNNEVPKTGESNFGMIVAITAIAVVLIVGTTVVVIRRKKESDAD